MKYWHFTYWQNDYAILKFDFPAQLTFYRMWRHFSLDDLDTQKVPGVAECSPPPLVAMRSKEVWLVEKNRATVKPVSSVAPCWMKTYSESRIELQNLQILKKMLEKSTQFLSSEQPCEPKSLDVALKITGVEKITLGKLVVTVNVAAIWFEFWMIGG